MQTLSANVNDSIQNVAFNDIYLDSDGNISISYDLQAVLEGCAEVAQTLLGEMIYNTDQGIPYLQTVWIGVPNIEQFNNSLRSAFLNVPNVIEVISLITSQTNYVLNYSAIINTTFGTVTLSQEIVANGIVTTSGG